MKSEIKIENFKMYMEKQGRMRAKQKKKNKNSIKKISEGKKPPSYL